MVSSAVRTEADDDGIVEKLGRDGASKYSEVAARANFLGVDRPELQFPVEQPRKEMAAPSEADLKRVKSIACCIQDRDEYCDGGRSRGGECDVYECRFRLGGLSPQ